MSRLRPNAVAVRRLLVTRPWIYWVVVCRVAVGIAAAVLERVDRVDAAKRAWGTTVPVLVAEATMQPGDPIVGTVERMPVALVPPSAVDPADAGGHVAAQRIATGEIVTFADTVAGGPLALAPPGWLVVPIVESPASGAGPGERVELTGDGIVLAAEALIAGAHADATLVAVPADVAPTVAAAAAADGVTVLRVP